MCVQIPHDTARYRKIPIPHDADTARCRYRTMLIPMPIPHDAALEHSTMVWYPRGSHVRTDTARYRTIQVQMDKDSQGELREVPYQRVWVIMGNSMYRDPSLIS